MVPRAAPETVKGYACCFGSLRRRVWTPGNHGNLCRGRALLSGVVRAGGRCLAPSTAGKGRLHYSAGSLFWLLHGKLSPPPHQTLGGGMNHPEERIVRCRRRVQFSDVPAHDKENGVGGPDDGHRGDECPPEFGAVPKPSRAP